MDKVEDIMIDNRICLQPQKWELLYQAIIKAYPEREFPRPLILAGWNFSNDTEKRNRFCMHLEFAISAGIANSFLENMTKQDWHHLNE
jgi:hypothetical protein